MEKVSFDGEMDRITTANTIEDKDVGQILVGKWRNLYGDYVDDQRTEKGIPLADGSIYEVHFQR